MRTPWLAAAMALLLAACSSVLGYDDVSFEQGGAAGVGGASGSGSGGSSSGGESGTGATGGVPGAGGAGASGSGGGGAGGGSGGTPGSGGGSGDPYASERQTCVDTINDYRASIGLPPYQRWTEAESCADGEAQSDSMTGEAHGAFPACGEFAQNECPGYSTIQSTLTTCLAQMWAEGPGSDFQQHGHYINMSSTKYSRVACGFAVTASGDVWAVQDFQ